MAKAGNRQEGITVSIKNRAAAKGTFALARVDFSFERKQAFAVWYTDGTAGLYRRAEAPSAGDAFDGRTVTKVETGIEDKAGLFKDDSGITSVTAVDEGIRPKTTRDWFNGCGDLEEADLDRLDTSSVTDMGAMFCKCRSLTTLDVSGWDTSSVTDMHQTFAFCYRLSPLDVSGWDTSKVMRMDEMFQGCSSLATLDVSGWGTSSVTDMGGMFRYCSSLATLDVSGFDTSSVTNMGGMFYNCSSLRSLALGPRWTKSLAGTGLDSTLYGADGTAYALAGVPLGVAATYYTRAEYVPHARAGYAPQGDPAGGDDAEAPLAT